MLPTWSVVTKCAYYIAHLHVYSDWLIIKKELFCMGYSDKTWYVGSSGLKYYPCSVVDAHIKYLICIF